MTTFDQLESLNLYWLLWPKQAATRLTGLEWDFKHRPDEVESDEEPEPTANEEELSTDTLGRYSAETKTVTLFRKRLQECSEKLGVRVDLLREVVRLHEYGHAIFHVGFAADSTRMSLRGYKRIDLTVHETIAQLLTVRGIALGTANANNSRVRDAWQEIAADVFPKLEAVSPKIYSEWRKFAHLNDRQLRALLLATRNGTSLAEMQGWSLIAEVISGTALAPK